MKMTPIQKAQKQILKVVAGQYPQVYLVGGTALSMLYDHRISEDLDFFTQAYTRKLHKEIAGFIKRKTGYAFSLVDEETRKKYLPMAIYEFEIEKSVILKVDFVQDVAELFGQRDKNGIADIEDLYYRKMLAVIGWKAGESKVGKALAGGRQKAKDLFDVYYLSAHVKLLSQWFPGYFDQSAYERLTAWYLSIPKQKTIMELLDLVPGCDTKVVFKHLDDEIIHKLNREYTGI
ncbi:MAG: hypothetical protein COV74_06050 [Candidatus Omnitrophica bacterium CG11_big_fil_rev_8_21_14_0_20_45_26]|uniref:Nucleotidyl transferase AbiEii/AbiGii toxin family protein n=1 Tax=Candidatus Abzuiibacterium crystallinum TaxID=1974748 RepID=A0A2H0LNX7_9BACT|nr:MAG: hypothetical protein COV74_06050 [Candidatus Omnitrophica bacterium CG11_big_fil_rev_8_21_14_0_20_45_26]PIW65312.1 MAG: hypothetical protein COW12_02555 [Candidatus Omnitrophica bacterium CG12_big_fil_rev_8_21_14_0_65_45_16]